MSGYKIGKEYYLLGHGTDVFTLAELSVSKAGDRVLYYRFEREHDDDVLISQPAISYTAAPATMENYRKLVEIFPELEKPPLSRQYQDVSRPQRFAEEQYKEFAPTKFPCLCWVTNDPDDEPLVVLVTSKDEKNEDFGTSDDHWWWMAIPLTEGEINQLAKLNKEASNEWL